MRLNRACLMPCVMVLWFVLSSTAQGGEMRVSNHEAGSTIRHSVELLRGEAMADEPTGSVDARTLHHKVLCGYQGWFRCPDDSAKQGWRHWI